MDLRKGWEALKARLRGWYSAVFGGGTAENVAEEEETDVQASPSETSPPEESAQDTSPEITEDVSAAEVTEEVAQDTSVAFDGLVSAVCERLEHLCRNRQVVVCKKSNRMEWQVAGADFTDAYLFLLSIPGTDISRLRHHTVADGITYHLELPGGVAAELTDKTFREDTTAVLRLTGKGRCMLRINFINNQN